MSNMHKRKRRAASRPPSPPRLHWLASNRENEGKTRPAAALCVEAHEADLVVGQEAAALMLEAPSPVDGTPTKGERGSGLIRWDADGVEGEGVWVDRYDARLLLSALPSCSRQTDILTTPATPPSPSGWSDLPSDAEDTFFLSAAEAADLRHEKRRRLLDAAHDARLRALRATEGPGYEDEDDAWGGSDEEPGTAQHELMRRTAAHLHASPNRAQLEARILANHGADARFAFLRGRWRRAWVRAREEAREEVERAAQERENDKGKAGLMGLSGYGDSDSDEEGEAEGGNKKSPSEVSAISVDEAAKMEARRARAREWAARRRAERTEEQSS